MVKILIEEYKVNINDKNYTGDTALILAAQHDKNPF